MSELMAELGWAPPAVLPASWEIAQRGEDGAKYVVRSLTGGIDRSVIVSVSRELDGKRWVHLSVACPKRMPAWEDLVDARDALLGQDAETYQVIPSKARYINIHPKCLHLWHCLDGPALPDFTRGGDSL